MKIGLKLGYETNVNFAESFTGQSEIVLADAKYIKTFVQTALQGLVSEQAIVKITNTFYAHLVEAPTKNYKYIGMYNIDIIKVTMFMKSID